MGQGITILQGGLRLLALALILCGACAVSAAEAEKPVSLFDEANRLYEQGRYPEAIQHYETLLRNGISPQVLFNLGNAHFRKGDIGLAIANFQRARQLAPRDADILANLRFARQTVPGTVSVTPSLFSRVLRYFTLNEVATVMTGALWFWLAVLSLRQWQPSWRSRLRTTTMVCGFVFVMAATWLASAAILQHRSIAIVTSEQVSARFGPLEESQTAYTANDGAELRVTGSKGEWIQVQDRSGRPAWIHQRHLVLFP